MKTKPNTIQREASRWLNGPKARTRNRDGGPGGVREGCRLGSGHLRALPNGPIQLRAAQLAAVPAPGEAGLARGPRGGGQGGLWRTRSAPRTGTPPPVPLPGACAGHTSGCLIPHVQEWMPGFTGAGFAWGPRSHGWSLFPQPHTGQPPHLTQSWKPVLLAKGGGCKGQSCSLQGSEAPFQQLFQGAGDASGLLPLAWLYRRECQDPAGISVCAQGGVHCGEWAPWAWPLLLTSTWQDTHW